MTNANNPGFTIYTISSIAPLIHWVRPPIYLSYPAAAALYNIQSRYHARRGLTISGSILRINRGDVGKRRDNYSHEFWPGPAQGERAGWLAGTSPPSPFYYYPPPSLLRQLKWSWHAQKILLSLSSRCFRHSDNSCRPSETAARTRPTVPFPPLLHQRRPTAKHTERLSFFYYYYYYHLRGIKYTRPTRERDTRTQKLCFPSPLSKKSWSSSSSSTWRGTDKTNQPSLRRRRRLGYKWRTQSTASQKSLPTLKRQRGGAETRESLVDDKLLSPKTMNITRAAQMYRETDDSWNIQLVPRLGCVSAGGDMIKKRDGCRNKLKK